MKTDEEFQALQEKFEFYLVMCIIGVNKVEQLIQNNKDLRELIKVINPGGAVMALRTLGYTDDEINEGDKDESPKVSKGDSEVKLP